MPSQRKFQTKGAFLVKSTRHLNKEQYQIYTISFFNLRQKAIHPTTCSEASTKMILKTKVTWASVAYEYTCKYFKMWQHLSIVLAHYMFRKKYILCIPHQHRQPEHLLNLETPYCIPQLYNKTLCKTPPLTTTAQRSMENVVSVSLTATLLFKYSLFHVL